MAFWAPFTCLNNFGPYHSRIANVQNYTSVRPRVPKTLKNHSLCSRQRTAAWSASMAKAFLRLAGEENPHYLG